MKNILIFLLLFLAISCGSNSLKYQKTETIDCPPVFFASEHKEYIDSEEKLLTLENISFNAKINNYVFNRSCTVKNGISNFPLEILFLLKPIKLNSPEVVLPVYVALLDSENSLLETQYFSVSGKIKKDKDSENFVESEIIDTVNIVSNNKNLISKFIIGFMLDEKRSNIMD